MLRLRIDNSTGFVVNGVGAQNGYRAEPFTGETLIKTLPTDSQKSSPPVYWGWEVTCSHTNFEYIPAIRLPGGLYLAMVEQEIDNTANFIQHPATLDRGAAGAANTDYSRHILSREAEYAFLLSGVPNQADDATERATAANLPDGFRMEFKVFV